MKRFYETWLGSINDGNRISKADALRQAKVWLRGYGDSDTPYDHPYYWSAFVLVGDAR
jgi:CHAT domain-containing protein